MYFNRSKPGVVEREERRVFEYVGVGWHFQADEVAECVAAGRKESTIWSHEKSLLEMEIFDEVSVLILPLVRPGTDGALIAARQVRRQGSYKFRDGLEQ